MGGWGVVKRAHGLTEQSLLSGPPPCPQALVRDVSGSPASGIPVKVSATLSSARSAPRIQELEQNTDGSGQVTIPIIVSQSTSEVQLLVGYPLAGQDWRRKERLAGFWKARGYPGYPPVLGLGKKLGPGVFATDPSPALSLFPGVCRLPSPCCSQAHCESPALRKF